MKEEEGKRAGGGILNISAIIATRPSHAVCQPPQGAAPVQSYSAIHSSNTLCVKYSAVQKSCATECKRSLSSLHSCTWPNTLSHFSLNTTHCHHIVNSIGFTIFDLYHHQIHIIAAALEEPWDNLAADLIKSSRINLFRSYLSFISRRGSNRFQYNN